MPAAHCIGTTDGVILAADESFLELVARPEHQIIGVSYRALTHPDDFDKSARMLNRLEDRSHPVRLRKRYLRPNGSAIPALLFVTSFPNPDRLVTTLFWHEADNAPRPHRMWEAALRIRHVHSVRRAVFGGNLSTDPVGSLLIAIYLAEAEGRIVGVDQLARDAGLTPSTALRWLKLLQERGIIQRDGSVEHDVQLTHAGVLDVERTLEAVTHPPASTPDMF